VRQPRKDIRPAPFRSFKGRTYAAAVSPESVRIMAELGVGILIIPQKPWDVVAAELTEYRAVYREVNGGEALPTIAAGWTFCDRDPDRAAPSPEPDRRDRRVRLRLPRGTAIQVLPNLPRSLPNARTQEGLCSCQRFG
jgi:hypothetical protein